MNFKDKYSKEMNAVCLNEDFTENIIVMMKQAAQRKENVTMTRKPIKVLAVVVAVIALLSVSAYAISSYLSAKEVAEKTGYNDVAPLFENSGFTPQTITDENYSVTLHGVVSGSKLENIDGADVEETRSYIVVSVANTDGTPLSGIDGMPLQFSPLVGGFDVWKVNAWTLGAGASGLEHEGVLYYLFDTSDIEIFADYTVYVAAYEGFLPSADIFTLQDDGTIVYNENYQGFKAMFTFDLDETKADPEAVKEFIAQFEAQ